MNFLSLITDLLEYVSVLIGLIVSFICVRLVLLSSGKFSHFFSHFCVAETLCGFYGKDKILFSMTVLTTSVCARSERPTSSSSLMAVPHLATLSASFSSLDNSSCV